MSMQYHPLATQRIEDIVRFERAAAQVFADLGIGPRYVLWTVERAAKAQGVEVERVIEGLVAVFRRHGAPGSEPAGRQAT